MLNLSAGSSSYNIQRSLRFRSSASAYLSRTPSVAGNRTTWTWSGWLKRGSISNGGLFQGAVNSSQLTALNIGGSDGFSVQHYNSGTYNFVWLTNGIYRDPSAWYHVVVVFDTTQASASAAVKFYVNGIQTSTSFNAYTGSYSQNISGYVNSTNEQRIGNYIPAPTFFDGYLTEVNFIDGQALTPSSFGQTDPASGAWVPKKYTGTYGTNGFYLPFSNNSSTTTLGYDFSGNGNNWTTNNISLTSGATYDSMTDVPTLTSATAANYCVISPFQCAISGPLFTLSNGNLDYSCSASNGNAGRMLAHGTIALHTGKTYWEVTVTSTNPAIGISDEVQVSDSSVGNSMKSIIFYNGGREVSNTSATYTGSTLTLSINDIIGFAFDGTSMTLTCYKNGTIIGTYSGIDSSVMWRPLFGVYASASSTSMIANFGQRPFAYTPPTGFKSLNTFNLPTPAIQKGNKFMDATLYTGSSSSQIITNSGSMQPDLVWVKTRNASTSHEIYDSVRGAGIRLCSNETSADNPLGANGLTSFNSNGFTVPSTANYGINSSGYTFVAWQWKAGGTAVTNTAGSITSQVSANPTSGFSIVTYTGNGVNKSTVGHGLGVFPSMIIVKNRGAAVSGIDEWWVWTINNPVNRVLQLNSTGALQSTTAVLSPASTPNTSTTFTVGGDTGDNSHYANKPSSNYVAYCFAEVAGYSKFGSYTGNSSADGPFVYCGFRPKYVMYKRTDTTGDWIIHDSSRNIYNLTNNLLYPDTTSAEVAASGAVADFLSNGFKLRGASPDINIGTIIFAAFAENPFKYANAR